MFKHIVIHLETRKKIIDITDRVLDCVRVLGLRNGLVNVYSQHTTLGVRVFENEPLLLHDTLKVLEQFAPRSQTYAHDDIDCRPVSEDEPINGHSHIKSLLVNTSETVPVVNGSMQLGVWQRILLFELDSARQRSVYVSVLGDYA